MTPIEVENAVKVILASYPGQRQKMGQADVIAMNLAYRNGLADLRSDACTRAVAACIKTHKFIPTIAEIRDAYELEREAEIREASKRMLPVTSDTPSNARSSWAGDIAERLGIEMSAERKMREKAVERKWRDTPQADYKTPQEERTQPCGTCACCRSGRACIHVLQLDQNDRKDLARFERLTKRVTG
jgi:hypothetical protein